VRVHVTAAKPIRRIAIVVPKGTGEGELDQELRGFLETAAEEKMKQGMSRKDALRAVRLERGTLEVRKEVVRSAGWESFLEALWQDLRFAVRMLRKSPGFTAVAVLTLALGIGANTAIFSLVGAVLFRALPYRDPDGLVWATNFVSSQTQDFIFQNVYAGWRDQSHVFENIAAYLPSAEYTLTGAGFRTQGAQVTPSFPDVLGITPELGRNFRPQEGRPGGGKSVLLSDALWRSTFGSDPKVLGRVIALDGIAYMIVGVLPRDFEFLDKSAADLLVPFQFGDSATQEANGRVTFRIENMQVIARLRPGATESAAVTELGQINARVMRTLPASGKRLLDDAQVKVISLHDRQVGNVRPALLVLLATVGFVLLITCANVANMQLARAAAREKEVAIRAALGAARWRTFTGALIV